MPAERIRRLIASVQYAITAMEVNRSRLDDLEVHVAGCAVSPGVDAPAASGRKDKASAPLVSIRNVPGRAAMGLRPEGQLSGRSSRAFRSDIE